MRWPSLFDGVDSNLEDWIVDQMHTVSFYIINLIRRLLIFNCASKRVDWNTRPKKIMKEKEKE